MFLTFGDVQIDTDDTYDLVVGIPKRELAREQRHPGSQRSELGLLEKKLALTALNDGKIIGPVLFGLLPPRQVAVAQADDI